MRNLRKKYKRMRRKQIIAVMVLFLFGTIILGAAVQKFHDVILAEVKKQEVLKEEAEETKKPAALEKPIVSEEPAESEKPEEIEQWIGVGPAGIGDTYDASIISDKLGGKDSIQDDEKRVFLTFDDGTSTTVTPEILKVLDDYQVKATFFITGANVKKGGEKAEELIRQEVESGHAIANHSYSHDYNVLYPGRSLNLKKFLKDYEKNEQLLKDIIGEQFSTRVWRCPGGFFSWNNMSILKDYMKENDKYSIDWNSLSRDAEGGKKTASQLVQNVKETANGKQTIVVLMHDTYGKEETAKALPQIIEYFKANGYQFKTLS